VRSWRRPEVRRLPGAGPIPHIWNTASGTLEAADPGAAPATAGLYVCGITPYDSTHIGHAATYLAYDTLIRLWLDAGLDVTYVQNTTDVDDPLLQRAAATGVSWRALAEEQTERFRHDMERLSIIPPDHYIAVTERVDAIAAAVAGLLARDIAYRVGDDVYFDSAAAAAVSPWQLGDESHYDRELMLALSAKRGGDPTRPGKRDALDPVLWRGRRDGEPSWPSVVGEGRPGWHIECAVISAEFLHLPFTVNGGGEDLIFPHHEFTAGHAAAINGRPLASIHSHAGLVAFRGEKMSKSLGNLVFVSDLVESGVDARAVRLAILGQRYRDDWEWTATILADAQSRLARWTGWAADSVAGESSALLTPLRAALSQDLGTPTGIALVDAAIASGAPASAGDLAAIQALLGLDLS
jgi:L-cysteine:1D-myo-inositol 2-amino-2-deoxy-alpha-D-glucopyranoside ligase